MTILGSLVIDGPSGIFFRHCLIIDRACLMSSTLTRNITKQYVLYGEVKKILKQGNDLEKPAIEIVPDILNVLNIFKKNNNCLSFGMSGSGATCYGIFQTKREASDFKKTIFMANKTKNYWIWSGGLLKKRDLILAE